MIENICAEVLLTGLKFVSNKSIDLDTKNDYYVRYPNSTTYVVPDKYSLTENSCQQERFSSKIEKDTMKKFLVTIN